MSQKIELPPATAPDRDEPAAATDRRPDATESEFNPSELQNDLGPARVVPEAVIEADITSDEPSPIERAVRRALAASEEYDVES